MADDAAHKCAGSGSGKGTPAHGTSGNSGYASAAKATDNRTTGHALGGIAHVCASGTRGKRVGIAYELENGEIIYVPE